jgi:hypothetical protein
MKGFILLFAILLGIAATCGANSVQAATSSSLGMEDPTSLQVTSASPQHYLRQSTGHESFSSSNNNSNHTYRQLEYLDFNTDELGPEEIGFLVIVVVLLLLLCCCCSGGRRGGGCSLCDILAAICIWDMCCEGSNPSDFCLV